MLPKALRAQGEFVRLYDELIEIARQHEEDGLPDAVTKHIADANHKTQDPRELVELLAPTEKVLRRLGQLDRYIEMQPRNLEETRYRQKEVLGWERERDGLVKQVVNGAKKITDSWNAANGKLDESTKVRNTRYKKRMKELQSQGMTGRLAALEIHGEEERAGRNPPSVSRVYRVCYE